MNLIQDTEKESRRIKLNWRERLLRQYKRWLFHWWNNKQSEFNSWGPTICQNRSVGEGGGALTTYQGRFLLETVVGLDSKKVCSKRLKGKKKPQQSSR